MRLHRRRQAGFALLLIYVMAAGVAILLYREAPRLIFQAQREKEQLLIDRGEQYKRAIQLYVRKQKRFPQSLDDLDKAQQSRFLRRRYKDPLTGKDEWRLVHVDAAGMLTDSKVKKPQTPGQPKEGEQQAKTPSFVGEIGFVGSPPPGAEDPANQGAAQVALGRRASDRPAVQAGTAFGGGMVPGTPPAPGEMPQAGGAASFPGQPVSGSAQAFPMGGQQGFPGQPYPGAVQSYPGTAQPGFPGLQGQSPGATQVFPMPGGAFPGAAAGMPGQAGAPTLPGVNAPGIYGPGQQMAGQYPVQVFPGQAPGSQYYPGQQPATGAPAMGQGGTAQRPASIIGGYYGIGGQSAPTGTAATFPGQSGATPAASPFPGGFPGGPGFPAAPSAQGVASSQTGGAVPFPAQGGFGAAQPAVQPGQNPALDMIRGILTSPRPGGLPGGVAGTGAALGGGIAGVASKAQGTGIKVYQERAKYEEWEFIYDMKEDKTGAGAAAGAMAGQPGQNPQGTAGQAPSPFGSTPFGAPPAAPGGFGQPAGSFGQPAGGFGQPVTVPGPRR